MLISILDIPHWLICFGQQSKISSFFCPANLVMRNKKSSRVNANIYENAFLSKPLKPIICSQEVLKQRWWMARHLIPVDIFTVGYISFVPNPFTKY